jgi:all-trans-retinol dehydrogenase (NAD+)
VNTFAHFWTIQEFLPMMLKQNQGHIITIASTMGLVGSAGLSDYCASKHAVVGMTEALRMGLFYPSCCCCSCPYCSCSSSSLSELHRLGKKGVWTSLICPNAINTGMFEGISVRLAWLVPFLSEEEVANAVIRASQTGQTGKTPPFFPLHISLPPLLSLSLPLLLNICSTCHSCYSAFPYQPHLSHHSFLPYLLPRLSFGIRRGDPRNGHF